MFPIGPNPRAVAALALVMVGCSAAGGDGSSLDEEVEAGSAGGGGDSTIAGEISRGDEKATVDTGAGDEGATKSKADAGQSGEVDVGSSTIDGGPVTLETVHFFGRWDLKREGRAITVNSGSHLTARFHGTDLHARFDVSLNRPAIPTLAWKVDDSPWQEGEVAGDIAVAKGLTDGEHDVEILARGMDESQSRWSAPLTASLTFLGFEDAANKLIPTARPVRKKIEFLGDSITEGVLVQPASPGRDTWPWRTDALHAYPATTAMTLGAEWRQVGFGGQALTGPGHGGVPPAPEAFNWIYAGVPRDDWQADIVVINQGTNDEGAGATSGPFSADLKTFLDRVRAGYPVANLVVMRPFRGSFWTELKADVQRRNAAGDAKIVLLDTTGWLQAEDFTDGLHPNVQGSVKIATRLSAALR